LVSVQTSMPCEIIWWCRPVPCAK